MAAPPGYELYADKYADWIAGGGDPEAFVPVLPHPPVAANIDSSVVDASIPKAWERQKENAASASKDADAAWPDGTGEVSDVGTPFVSADGSGDAEPFDQTYGEAVATLT
jgi:hypothetical protein